LLFLVAGLIVVIFPSPGSATVGTMTITTDTTLTEDHYGSIEIAADDVTLDCAGFSLIGPSPDDWPVDGVLIDQHSGVTIKNCVATGFVNGFKLQGVTESTLVGNTATANEETGFFAADGSKTNVFRENVSFDNIAGQGFAFDSGSGHNVLRNSTAYGNGGVGVGVNRSRGNELRGNLVRDNAHGFVIGHSGGTLLVENVARGNAGDGFAFWGHSRGASLVENVARGNGGDGFAFSDSRGDSLVENAARGNGGDGFIASESSNMILRGNSAIGNGYGFTFDAAEANVLIDNIARSNGDNGFSLCRSSSGNVLKRNLGLRNNRGFYVCRASHDNVFKLNRANRNVAAGFGIEASDGNRFEKNRAMGNGREGFYLLFDSNNNTLIRNVACGNGIDAHDDGTGIGNVWGANRFCTDNL
jgi:parallel beta-helix repeat protein